MFDKRSEGNYNKQENSSKTKGNEPGFWENLKALVAENKVAAIMFETVQGVSER